MRHVDNPHQAISNGQSQRHQQQNTAQADPAENRAQFVAPCERSLDPGQRRLQCDFHIGIGLGAQALNQHGFGAWVVAGGKQSSRFEPFVLVAAAQQNGRTHQLQLAFEPWHRFSREGLFNQWQAGFIAVSSQGLEGIPPHLLIFGKQLERRQRVIEFAAHDIGIDHVFRISRQGQLRTRDRIKGLVTLDYQHPVAAGLDGIVRQRLDERRCFFVGMGCGLVQGLHTGLDVANCHAFYLVRR